MAQYRNQPVFNQRKETGPCTGILHSGFGLGWIRQASILWPFEHGDDYTHMSTNTRSLSLGASSIQQQPGAGYDYSCA
jgi:hypothetical protein